MTAPPPSLILPDVEEPTRPLRPHNPTKWRRPKVIVTMLVILILIAGAMIGYALYGVSKVNQNAVQPAKMTITTMAPINHNNNNIGNFSGNSSNSPIAISPTPSAQSSTSPGDGVAVG